MKRCKLTISGDVQGVGLEEKIREQCRTYKLDGTSQKMGDKLIVTVQGLESQIRKLITWLKSDPGKSDVVTIAEQWQSLDSALPGKGFKILG